MHKVIKNNILKKVNVSDCCQWYALQTKYKTEKYVVEQLKKKGIEAYVPLIKVTKRYERKIKNIELPLINCYVFIRIDLKDKVRALQTEYVYRFVSQTGKEERIADEEINLLKRVVGEFEGQVNSGQITYSVGEEVEVISGSLTGIKGKLLKKSGKHNFVVELTSIGYELQIEMNEKMLRPLN
jgi:transcription antitermination factor NusG